MQIRCLTLASFAAPYASTYVHSTLALDEEMYKRGNTMTYVFPKEAADKPWIKSFQERGRKIYFIDFKPYSIGNIRAIRKIIRQENINIIHSHFAGWDITAKIANPFVPCIWHERMNVDVKNKLKKIKNMIKFKFFGAIRTFSVGVSDVMYESIKSLVGEKKCMSLPNAVDLERFDEKENYESETTKILMFGWAPIVKGVDTACSAMEEIKKENINAELYIVSQEMCDEYLKKRYKILPDYIKILPPNSNVTEYYVMADVFLSASRSEGFSCSLLEALYSGLPVIVSDIETTKWSGDFNGSFFFKTADASSLTEAIKEFISSDIDVNRLKENRARIAKDYSREGWVNKVINIFDEKVVRE